MNVYPLSLDAMPLLNGAFDFFDDVTTLSAAGYIGTAHRLHTLGTGGSPAATVNKQTFTFGAAKAGNPPNEGDPPGDLVNFLRWAQTALASTTSPEFQSRMENVWTFAGHTVCASFWYRSNQALTVGMRQSFGTGGSPSGDVDTALQTIPATADASGVIQWRRCILNFVLPFTLTKALGSTANTSYLALRILGPLNVVFQYDLADLKLYDGSQATPDLQRRPSWQEAEYLKRYFLSLSVFAPVSTQSANGWAFPRTMRIAPTITGAGATHANITTQGASIISAGAAANIALTADARL